MNYEKDFLLVESHKKFKDLMEGVWQDEPDKLFWVDEETKLDCLIVRGPLGALCGYVGVPENHPFYDDGDEDTFDVDVHGGITFQGFCHGDICHPTEIASSEKVRWLRFDCAHCGDLVPGDYLWLNNEIFAGDEYRDVSYVKKEAERLAKQLYEKFKSIG